MDEILFNFESLERTEEPISNPFGEIQNKQIPEANSGEEVEFMIPNLSEDMDENDFSWLFRILPQETENHSQNSENDNITFYQHHEDESSKMSEKDSPVKTNQNERTEELSTPMLMDPILSNLNVSSLFTPGEIITPISILTFSPTESATDSQPKRRFNAGTRNRGRGKGKGMARGHIVTPINRNGCIIETPILRRSQRKRDHSEMMTTMQAEATPSEEPAQKMKRTRKASEPKTVFKTPSSFEFGTVTETVFETPHFQIVKPQPPLETKQNPSLKMIFRKHKPVNPIDKTFISSDWEYQNGLLHTDKHLSAELYLKHSIYPRIAPGYEDETYITDAITATPLDINEIRKRMKREQMEKHNEQANFLAHGGGNVTQRKIHGLGVIDLLTNDFELLFAKQESAYAKIQARLLKEKPNTERSVANETLNKTFANFSNFDDYFDEPVKKKQQQMKLNPVVGAVPVRPLVLAANETFFNNKAIFQLKGQLYRPNPLVIPIVRLPDQDILAITSKPKLPSVDCPYYSKLTSYCKKPMSSASARVIKSFSTT